jgi:hypothetical protein
MSIEQQSLPISARYNESGASRTSIEPISLRAVGIDWPVLTYWVTYLSIVSGILYAVISEAF